MEGPIMDAVAGPDQTCNCLHRRRRRNIISAFYEPQMADGKRKTESARRGSLFNCCRYAEQRMRARGGVVQGRAKKAKSE